MRVTRKNKALAAIPEAIRSGVQATLETFPEIELCVLFGSVARGRLGAHSDIDIGIAAQSPLDVDRLCLISATFSRNLHKEIDLLDLKVTHGLILSEAMTKGIVEHCSNRDQLYQLMKEVVYFNEDFRPGIEMMMKRRVERFING